MHAITLNFSLSYAAAVRLGITRSGTDQIDAGGVLPLLDERERAWLAAHPKATFSLDDVVEDAADLAGDRLARAVAREVRSACAADDPARLRAAIAAQLVSKLDDAQGGDPIAVYESVARRVSDGTSCRSGNLADLADEDVGPVMMTALGRYLDRCLTALRLPFAVDVDKAPALLRGAFADGRRRVLDAIVADVERQASDGPLTLHVNPLWARKRFAEGSLGVSRSTVGDGWIVGDGGSAVHDARLAGVIEAAIVAAEARLAAVRAAEEAQAREAEDAILAVLDPDQRARRALGALPDHELHGAVDDALLHELQKIVGDSYSVSLVVREDADDVDVRWGELPRGGGDVAAKIHGQSAVEEWGDASDLGTGPLVAVRAVDLLERSRVLLIERV
jgi:hypothetical protein